MPLPLYSRIAVYVIAHQDDWQLFMDPYISADLNDVACKTIIIHTTAGDAGEGKKYWRAREWGAINSLKFRICQQAAMPVVNRYIAVNKKNIFKAQVARCSIYFLRLPDGGYYGEGFAQYGFQSLLKLRTNTIDAIASVDGKNSYSSFTELSLLISEIINRELRAGRLPKTGCMELNFPEYDDTLNPGDHNDHLHTALLVTQMDMYAAAKKRAFVHYHIQHAASDLTGPALFWKVGMFSVYHQTVLDMHGHSTIGETPLYSVWSRKMAVYREIH